MNSKAMVSAIEIQEMLNPSASSAQTSTAQATGASGYIIKSIKVLPTGIEMALFGRANLGYFTLAGGVFARVKTGCGTRTPNLEKRIQSPL